jgi:hypothetical protein
VELVLELGVSQDRSVEEILETGLIVAVQVGEFEDTGILSPVEIQVLLQHDAVLSQGSRLVSTQDVHRAEVLNRIQPLDDHLLARPRDRSAREIRGHDHRQHLGRQAYGHGRREKECFDPIALGDAIDEKHHRNHHQHEPNEHPGDTIDTLVEAGQAAVTDDRFRQRAKISARTGGDDDRGCRPAQDTRAHEGERRLFERIPVRRTAEVGGLVCGGRDDCVRTIGFAPSIDFSVGQAPRIGYKNVQRGVGRYAGYLVEQRCRRCTDPELRRLGLATNATPRGRRIRRDSHDASARSSVGVAGRC